MPVFYKMTQLKSTKIAVKMFKHHAKIHASGLKEEKKKKEEAKKDKREKYLPVTNNN